MSELLTGLPAAIVPGARLLILGSLPGAESLRRGEYYAHPRNRFWDIVETLFAIPRAVPYAERLTRLGTCGVGLWDVVARGRRRGSLDAGIDTATVEANDFAALFAAQPALTDVCFNGQKAAALYRKLVLPQLSPAHARLVYHTLPSTSPAHAALSAADKYRRWAAVLQPVCGR